MIVWVRWTSTMGRPTKWHIADPRYPGSTRCSHAWDIPFEHERVLETPITPEGMWPPIQCSDCATIHHRISQP